MRKVLAGFMLILVLVLTSSLLEVFSPLSLPVYGITFSPAYAQYLGLNWQETYLQILDTLQVKHLRVPGYWDILQPQPDQYDFTQTDYLLDEAGKRGARITLVLGVKQPRWPECHVPAWAKKLDVGHRQQKTLEFIAETVERYKNHPAVAVWQVENEPFVSWFGENCDSPDKKFLQQEITTVKQIDATRQVIVTDSGEWSSWVTAMKLSDTLGISLYRKAYNETLDLYSIYPFPAWMYTAKSNFARILAPANHKTIISELQTEPWPQKGLNDTSVKEQSQLFTIKDFQDNINYARKTGFRQMYLWGAEWWYFMAQQGHPEYLEYAKTLFR